ncbi:MAG: recombination mediator RecR [bacterium]
MPSDALNRVIYEFRKMPGIGARTAGRLALYLMRIPARETDNLCQAISDLKAKVGYCSGCGNLTETDPCAVCSDTRRDRAQLCVVEEPKDQLAIEKSGGFKGIYHILMGRLSPLDNITPEDLRISSIIKRVKTGVIKEVILATSPTLEGEATAVYLSQQLKPLGVKITRIARGIPMGGELEFADELTITKALEGRQSI